MKGVIVKGVGGLYTVLSQGQKYVCRPKGIFRKQEIVPLPGDEVDFDSIDGVINSIYPRRNELIRPKVANIDTLIITLSAQKPYPDMLLADKLTVFAQLKGITPVIAINKSDIAEDGRIDFIKQHFKGTGFECVSVSAKGENGIVGLLDVIEPGTVVFAGQSGVGKSSLINAFMPKLMLEEGELSSSNDRGKHTTRQTEFFSAGNGIYIADTPGFSKLNPADIEKDELSQYFPEHREYARHCSFSLCSHISEPDCCVRQAVEDGKISKTRYNNYIEIRNEIINSKKY